MPDVAAPHPPVAAQANRTDVAFASAGQTCRAWWYPPAVPNGACVVMAHGLGGLRTAGLDPYARHFAAAGFAVLLFDYRHFGDSDGEPRQLVSVPRQLADWAAAVRFARAQPGVDPDRVALWGSSFSGGHVIVTAAHDARVAAVCAQGAMLDGLAATLNIVRYAGVGQVLRLAARGVRDVLHATLGRAPVLIPLVGAPGTLATMSTPDAVPGYRRIVGPDWINAICARFALALSFYRPVTHAHHLRCPVLLIAVDDSVAPASAMRRAAQRIGPRCELHTLPMGHFDLYVDDGFRKGVDLQTGFLLRALGSAVAEDQRDLLTGVPPSVRTDIRPDMGPGVQRV